MSAIEVLKKYSTSCSVCKYNGGDQCKASGGEFGECRSAEELSKAINKAIVALEKQESDKILFLTLNKENAEFRKERAKLKEWLEKEIALWKVEVEKSKDKEKYEDWVQSMNEQRLWAYEEVLERVGEQK